MADSKKLRDEYCSVCDGLPPVKVTYDVERETWILVSPYTLKVDDTYYNIPLGFEFDLASIPRGVWTLIAPFELSLVAPLIHDFMYVYKGDLPVGSMIPPRQVSRKEADKVFYKMMKVEGVSWWRRSLAYRAVRWFGGSSWKN